MKQNLNLLCIAVLALLIFGCRPLAPEGVYKGDTVLYGADKTITESYDILHAFVSWEFQNRQALAGTPEIRKTADAIRSNASKWIDSAIALREAYAANPTDANRTALTHSLAVLREALVQAQRYLAAHK